MGRAVSSYIVRLVDTDQGYADEEVYGAFRTLETAEAFAERVEQQIKNPDEIRVIVNRVQAPRIKDIDAGWFEEGGGY